MAWAPIMEYTVQLAKGREWQTKDPRGVGWAVVNSDGVEVAVFDHNIFRPGRTLSGHAEAERLIAARKRLGPRGERVKQKLEECRSGLTEQS